MKKIYLMAAAIVCGTVLSTAQSFNNSTTMLSANHNSGGCTAVVDMDNDGLDDIVILDMSTDLKIAYQQMDGSFDLFDFGSVSSEAQWGMSVGDIDNDGHKDVVCGGSYDNVHLVNINGPGDFVQTELTWASIFYQGSCIGDINNDGWLDAYLCHDDGEGVILSNTGTGAMTNGTAWMDFDFSSTDDSGNYGSTFTDFDRDGDIDLFIAKCRQFVSDPYDARRTNRLMVNDGNNNYTEEAAERGLVNLQQTWTSDWVDADNDGDYDCFLTTHSGTLELYANDGLGYFTNVTAGSGLEVSGFFLQAKWADFDNDGWQDLVHAGGDHRYFHNNGDMTFTSMANMFPSTDVMHSFAIGDLNHDGWLDLYASYGDGYVTPDTQNDDKLFMNNGGDNNFIVFDLEGVISNKDACGATVEIHGPFGVQIREVRDGESYGITNTGMCHFGLGSNTTVDYALVYWPSGIINFIDNPTVNGWNNILEEECTSPTATISATGSTNICPGESVMLNIVSSEGSYQWSNGATSSSIEVTQAGSYSLIVWDAACGGTSNTINVTVIENTPATVSLSGDNAFCEGGSAQIIASSGSSYLWSNGATSQAITVTESGTYSVAITNACAGSSSTSETVSIDVFDAPIAPAAADVTINAPGTANLSVASGTDIRWYDAVNATVPVGTGLTYTTPVINTTTSFWVEDVMTHGGTEGTGGKATQDMTAEGVYHNSVGFYLTFDANENITIQSVKVFCQTAGNKTIQIVQGATVVAETTVAVPAGESVVTINLFVPAGTGYGLKCNTNNHGFWRDKNLTTAAPYNFPYDLDGLGAITGTNVNNTTDQDNYYYYFYDWTVVAESWECLSPREEVVVTYVGINEIAGVSAMNVYPNPASDLITVSYTSLLNGKMSVKMIDQTGRVVKTANWNSATGANNFQMELSDVATGIYQLEFTMNGTSASSKIIVE